MKLRQVLLVTLLLVSVNVSAQKLAQWRGPNRNGVFPEKGLLKSWPEEGPRLKWSTAGLGDGYSSVSVAGNRIYLTGREDDVEYLSELDTKGQILWRMPFGLGVQKSYQSSRCTPTVEDSFVYLISGRGEVVCIDRQQRKKVWSVPAFEKFLGVAGIWEVAESPLLVQDKVIYTPCGPMTTMIALNKKNGEIIWQTESLSDTSAFASPILIEFQGKKIITTVASHYFFGVEANSGKILWKVDYSNIKPQKAHLVAPIINCITPLYHDGQIFITSGYNHVGVMFKLGDGGNNVEQRWINETLDCHHGQVVRIGNYIYGANWLNNANGNWCCVDWKTGKTMYEKKWYSKGSISAAEGLLYCYEEKRGNLALVQPDPTDFKIISTFPIKKGRGRHWTQPVIVDGVLYIRHGAVLMAFDVKA